jgi:hypothetical protein
MLNELGSVDLENCCAFRSDLYRPWVGQVVNCALLAKKVTHTEITEDNLALIVTKFFFLFEFRRRYKLSGSSFVEEKDVIVLVAVLLELVATLSFKFQPQYLQLLDHISTTIAEFRPKPHQEINFSLSLTLLPALEHLVIIF